MKTSLQSTVRSPQSHARTSRTAGFGLKTVDCGLGTGDRGFTLIELLLAIGVTAMVLIAVNAVFFSAMRLRESTNNAVDESLPVEQTLAAIRRDLQGLVPPNGTLSGDFKVGGVTSLGSSLPVDIELYTTTGALLENEPWGEVQRVTYALRLPGDRSLPGRDLIRSVTRNLLSTLTPQPEEQWMLGGVESVEFYCYDGSQWRNTWDTSVTDTNLPSAIRVRMQLAGSDGGQAESPVEFVVPVDAQSRTNQTGGG
jgi:type II secretion system protein J